MLKNIRRFALIASCGAALTALFSLTAEAASSSSPGTTLPATHVTYNSAQLNAEVSTRGQMVQWQFYYGLSNRYGFYTKRQTIEPGRTKPVKVFWTIKRLKPNTTYHFTVVVFSGIGTHYTEKFKDGDQSFKTRKFPKKHKP